jgi:hypothetical protein
MFVGSAKYHNQDSFLFKVFTPYFLEKKPSKNKHKAKT